MIRPTSKNVAIMAIMVNARTTDRFYTRYAVSRSQTQVRGNYIDVLLKRLLDEGLILREKVMGHRGRRVWGYKATEFGYNWYVDPSVRGIPPGYTQVHEVAFIPLEDTIERDGWVERWNKQVIHIPEWAAKKIRRLMKKSRNYQRDSAKQRVHDSPALHAVTTYSRKKGYTLRIKFRLEPWRDHLAEWLGYCGLEVEEIRVFVEEIEKQLPGSFKQQEHRVIGRFGSAVRAVEGKFKIKTTDLDTGKTMMLTEMEYSRRGELQLAGDGQVVDSVAGALAAYQHEEVIRISQERGAQKRNEEAIVLMLQGKKKEAMKLLGLDPDAEDVTYFG